jgi:CDP-paratose synthetase
LNILITGASGFLGSALARRLGASDHQVSLLARKSTNLYRLGDVAIFNVGRFEADLEIKQFIAEVRPDIVIHAACCYGRKDESMMQIFDSNIRFGAVILESIKGLNKKISFLNTGTVLSKEVSLYAHTKIQFEELGASIAITSNQKIQFINIKLQHIYGPGDDGSKFTSYVINSCKNNVPTLPLTLGEQKRDFVFIDDAVDAFVKIIENLPKLDVVQKIELGSGSPVSLREFVEIVHELTNSKTELLYGAIKYRANEEMCLVANIEYLKNLGWKPIFGLKEGIKKTIEMDAVR